MEINSVLWASVGIYISKRGSSFLGVSVSSLVKYKTAAKKHSRYKNVCPAEDFCPTEDLKASQCLDEQSFSEAVVD